MRVFWRIVLCCVILTFVAKLFAGARSDVRHLGQTSYVRAVTLHRIESSR
jgi:hypothetical protein